MKSYFLLEILIWKIPNQYCPNFYQTMTVKIHDYFKNPENPRCIDLFITNSNMSFQNTTTVATGLSDFHKMIVTVCRNSFPKPKPFVYF